MIAREMDLRRKRKKGSSSTKHQRPTHIHELAGLALAQASDPPAFPQTDYFFFVAEGPSVNRLMGTLTATDPQGQIISYTLSPTPDSIYFSLDECVCVCVCVCVCACVCVCVKALI